MIDSLSGFFCASLTQMHPLTTTRPNMTMAKGHAGTFKGHEGQAELRALLSSENVCTENLTPWMKLLPCKRVRPLSLGEVGSAAWRPY